MTSIDRLLLVFLVTTLGSALSSVCTFLSIEQVFNTVAAISVALSAKTLASVATSYFSGSLVDRFGLKCVLRVSQWVGIVGLAVLAAGYRLANYEVLLLGIVLTGVPSPLVFVVLTAVFRNESASDQDYRRQSARRELRYGVALLVGTVSSPWLLHALGIEWVLAFDAITFVAAAYLVGRTSISENLPEIPTKARAAWGGIYTTPTWIYLCSIVSALGLVAIVPLVAASQEILAVPQMPQLLRESLWTIDSLASIGSALLYRRFREHITTAWLGWVLALNGGWLLLPAYSASGWALVVGLSLSSFSMWLLMLLATDNYVLAAGADTRQVQRHASFAVLVRSALLTASPLLLAWAFAERSPQAAVLLLVLTQSVLLGCTLLLRLRPKHSSAAH